MKKFFIIIIFVVLVSILLAEDMHLQEIKLDKFTEEYLPNYIVKKQLQLEGELISYDFAKDSGEIIAVTNVTNNYKVQIYDKEGTNLCIKNYDQPVDCKFSDSGEIFCIASKYNFEVFLRNGNLYSSSKKMNYSTFLPSPNGNYFYRKTGMMDSKQKEIIIYDRELNEHKLNSTELENISSIRYRFVADNRILAVIDGWIKIFSFSDFEIELLNAIKLNPDKYLGELNGEFHYRKTDYSEEYFGIVVYEDGLYVFDVNGNLVYRDETKYDMIKFTNNENLIVSSYGVQKKISLINLKTNKKTNIDFSFEWSNKGFHFIGFLDNCSIINEIVICNVITGNSQFPQYCLILNAQNSSQNVKSLANTYIDILDSEIYILQLEKNPKFNLLELKNE